jgi:hypothetical protein
VGCHVRSRNLVEPSLDLARMLGHKLLLALDKERLGLGNSECDQQRSKDEDGHDPRNDKEEGELTRKRHATLSDECFAGRVGRLCSKRPREYVRTLREASFVGIHCEL